jgi:hypothetical protein
MFTTDMVRTGEAVRRYHLSFEGRLDGAGGLHGRAVRLRTALRSLCHGGRGGDDRPKLATPIASALPAALDGFVRWNVGWGGRIRTFNLLIHSDLPYRRWCFPIGQWHLIPGSRHKWASDPRTRIWRKTGGIGRLTQPIHKKSEATAMRSVRRRRCADNIRMPNESRVIGDAQEQPEAV